MEKENPEIEELKRRLEECSKELLRAKEEGQNSARLLIRRDLALSRANEKLLALDKVKSEFISIAAHQLRTPLSVIKWILHMVVNNEFKDEKEKSDFIEKASVSTDQMIALVNDLLEVDHIQSGRDHFIFEPTSVYTIIQSIISDMDVLIKKNGLNISFNSVSDLPVIGDKEKLKVAFQNLLENAVKYNNPNGSIFVSLEPVDKFLKITISDTGIGIPENQYLNIFTKFFRAPNAMKVNTVGSGFGLFIVKQVVERHGGQISFVSKLGEGTSFTILLPLWGGGKTS